MQSFSIKFFILTLSAVISVLNAGLTEFTGWSGELLKLGNDLQSCELLVLHLCVERVTALHSSLITFTTRGKALSALH